MMSIAAAKVSHPTLAFPSRQDVNRSPMAAKVLILIPTTGARFQIFTDLLNQKGKLSSRENTCAAIIRVLDLGIQVNCSHMVNFTEFIF